MNAPNPAAYLLCEYNPTTQQYVPFAEELPDLNHLSINFDGVPSPIIKNLSDGSQMRVFEALPSATDFNEDRVIVRIMDFANEVSPHAYMAALAMADVFGYKVLILPQNDITLQGVEKQRVRSGDLSPLANKWAETIECTAEHAEAVSLFGYSLGAQAVMATSSVLNATMKRNDIVVAAEPPNTLERTSLRLLTVFLQATNPQLAQAMSNSNWRPYMELTGVGATGDVTGYITKGGLKFIWTALCGTNRAIIGAMCHYTFSRDCELALRVIPENGRIIVAREHYSPITFTCPLETLAKHHHNVHTLSIAPKTPRDSVGHAVGNDPRVPIALLQKAHKLL